MKCINMVELLSNNPLKTGKVAVMKCLEITINNIKNPNSHQV